VVLCHSDEREEGNLDDTDWEESDIHSNHTNMANVAPSPRNMDEGGNLDVGIESVVHESQVAAACEDSHKRMKIAHVAEWVVLDRNSDRRDGKGETGLCFLGEIHAQEEVDVKSERGVHQKILYWWVVFHSWVVKKATMLQQP